MHEALKVRFQLDYVNDEPKNIQLDIKITLVDLVI